MNKDALQTRLKNSVTNKLKAGIWRKITERVSKNHVDLHLDLDLDVESKCRISIIVCLESISKFKIDMAHQYKDLDLCQVAGYLFTITPARYFYGVVIQLFSFLFLC